MSKHRQSPEPDPDASSAAPPRPQAPMKLEGRVQELQRLSDGLDRATVGLVLGFAGMGKTALTCRLFDELERGDLTLEASLTAFERGIRLTRSCQQALDAALAHLPHARFVGERFAEVACAALAEFGGLE